MGFKEYLQEVKPITDINDPKIRAVDKEKFKFLMQHSKDQIPREDINTEEIVIKFDTTNAAFENWADEVANVLTILAQKIAGGQTPGFVMDSNGNKIGTITY